MSVRLRSAMLAVLIVTSLALALAPAPAAPLGAGSADEFVPQLITVDTPTDADKDRLLALGLDVTEHAGHDYVEVVTHSAADVAALQAAGFTWDVRIADLIARQTERIALDEAFAAENAVTDLPSGRNGYRVLADFGTEIDALVTRYPTLAKRISIGRSVEGRDLTGIEIGVDVNAPEDGRPVFLMFGAHHAREWPSAELPMEFAYDLLQGFTNPAAPDHDRIIDLLTNGRAIIVPVSNPDGYDASRTSGNLVDLRDEAFGPVTGVPDGALGAGTTAILATPGNAYRRKNCRYADGQAQPAGTCVIPPSNGGLGLGVDLNRNYGALWGGPGASGDRTSALYRGPAPFSEPETQAIRNLISTRQVTTLITNHTFSNLILRPVGVNPATIGPDGSPIGFAPDECFTRADGLDYGMQALGEAMAAQNGYTNQFGWELYDTTGTTEDYSYNATGGYGYTFEIGAGEFHPPYADVVDEYEGTSAAAERVETLAAGPDALTTATADVCEGEQHEHDEVGGGNRAAYLLAFENAVDAGTHSVITGTAPAGSTVTVRRAGSFPLWDGSPFADTVTTSMVVGSDGVVDYHVNPSTRPFVDSRKAPQLSVPTSELTAAGTAPPLRSTSTPFVVTQDADLVRASVEVSIPVDGQAVNYAQMHLDLLAPGGTVVATADAFGPSNSFIWYGPDGEGVEAGTYTLRVRNNAGATSGYDLEAFAQDVLAPVTTRTTEFWTVTCTTPGGTPVVTDGVEVDRGQTADIGAPCS